MRHDDERVLPRALQRALLASILPAVVLAQACAVTGEDVEKWKGTVKGPGKIVAVMVSDTYPLELRTQAALALVEMERQDVDGVDELQGALQRLEPDTRHKVIGALVGPLEKMLQGGDSTAPVEENTPPDPRQVRAKDAAYLLIRDATPENRTRLMKAVVQWYVQDFNGRSLAGAYSAEQVIRSLGTPAASLLVDALDAKMPPQALVKLSSLIAELGNDEAKAAAAAKLVAIEKELESDAFLDWLKNEITEQLKEQDPDRKVDPGRIAQAAELNRSNFIADGALPAMKALSEYDVVASRLLEIAKRPAPADDPVMTDRRSRALAALAGNRDEKHLSALLDLALGDRNPGNVRDQAFERIGEIGSKAAIPRLWPLVEDEEEDALRWRAGELVLGLGGPEVVDEFLKRLPDDDDVAYAPGELEGYATRMSTMQPAPTERAQGMLGASNWWERIIGLEYFARRGTEADVDQMRRLTSDDTRTVGRVWPDDVQTVGQAAKKAIASLRERLSEPDDEEGESPEAS